MKKNRIEQSLFQKHIYFLGLLWVLVGCDNEQNQNTFPHAATLAIKRKPSNVRCRIVNGKRICGMPCGRPGWKELETAIVSFCSQKGHEYCENILLPAFKECEFIYDSQKYSPPDIISDEVVGHTSYTYSFYHKWHGQINIDFDRSKGRWKVVQVYGGVAGGADGC